MKKVIRRGMLLTLVLVLVCFAAISCKKDSPPVDNTPTEVFIVRDGASEYSIIYPSSNPLGGRYAYTFNQTIASLTGINLGNGTSDSAAEGIKEILLGDTSRQLSKDLKADLEAKAASDSFIWGFAYRDGQFAFYFNNQTAFDRGLEEFKATFIKDGCFVASSDTWVTRELTLAAYNAELEAEKQVKLNERLNAITAEITNAAYTDADFGATAGWLTDYAMPTDKYEPTMSITESHPRVFLTKDTIPKIKALLEDPDYKNIADKFWEMADSEDFTGIFPERTHTTQSTLKDGTKPTGYETYRFDGEILAEIEARALAYLVTGHKAYAYEAIHGIKNAMLSYKYTQENHMDVYHGPSQIMVILAEVYDWCYDALTDTDKKQLISGCVYLLIEAKQFTDDDFVLDMNKPSLKATLSQNQADYGLEFNFPPNNMNAVNGHGTGPQFLRDYMMVTVAFADEMPSWWDFVGGRFCREYLPAAVEMYKNGYANQGTAIYATMKIYYNLVPAYLLKTATGTSPYPDYVAKCAEFMMSHLLPNGKLFETGDGARTREGADFITNDGYVIFYFFAALYNDTLSLNAAKEYSENFTRFITESVGTSCGPALALALCGACDKSSGTYPDDLPLYTYTAGPGGQTVARSSWENDAAAAFMRVGERTMGNHDHAESGTFQIYYKGYLALTSGFYGKYGSTHHKNYHQMTVSKNGLLIYNPALKDSCDGLYSGSQRQVPSYDNLELWQSDTYNMGEVTGVLNKEGEYSYLAGDITQAYDTKTVDYVGRRMLTVFTDDEKAPMMFFVYDSITSDDESFKKSFLLHIVNEPTITGTATDKAFTVTPDANGKMSATIVNGEGALVLQSVYGGDYMHKIGGEGFACWIGNENEFDGTEASGINCPQGSYGDMYEKIWGRVEITTRGEKKSDMLNVMYVTDSGDIKNMPAVLVEDTEKAFVGATLGNTTAMFARNESRSSATMIFTTSGEGTMRYFISGLYEGTWKVSINGGAVKEYKASADSGMIVFDGACGTVTVTPGGDVVPEGYSKIEYKLNGGTLPAEYPTVYKEGEVTELPIPTKENAIFLGWYNDKNFTTKITEIPAIATNTFKVYAKFFTYDEFVNYDYSSPNESFMTLQNDTQSSTKIRAEATLTLDTEKGALVWSIKKGVSKLYKRSTPLISDIDSEDHAMTYVLTLSRKVGTPVPDIGFKFQVSGSATGKNYGNCNIFTIRNNGNVYLCGDTSKLITTLPEDGSAVTITVAVDFDGPNNDSAKATFTAYGTDGETIAEKQLAVTNTNAINDGVDTMYKWSKWLSTTQAWFECGQAYDVSKPTAICFHKIYAIETDIIKNPIGGDNELVPEGHARIEYELNGGRLSASAPKTYKVGEALILPIPTKDCGIFLGWYTDAEFTTKITEIPTTATETFKVYAKFQAGSIICETDLNELELERVSGNTYKFNEDPKSNSNLFVSTEVTDAVSTKGGANIYKEGQKGFIYSEWDLVEGASNPSSDNNNHYKITLNELNEDLSEMGIVYSNSVTMLCDTFTGGFQFRVVDYYAKTTLDLTPVKITSNGEVKVNGTVVCTLKKNVTVNIAVHIRIVKPTTPDAVGDLTTLTGDAFTAKYGAVVFDAYIDGVMVAESIPLITEAQQKGISTVYKDTDSTAVTGLATDFKISYLRFTSSGSYTGVTAAYDAEQVLRLDAVKAYSSNIYLETVD